MKAILILCLVCFTFSYWGPAGNDKFSTSSRSCKNDSYTPDSLSDCVDLNLYSGRRYYDRCCFVRMVLLGTPDRSCVPLTEEKYLDIVQTKEDLEKQFDEAYLEPFREMGLIKNTEGYHTKIYQIDCASSYIKLVSIAITLMALLL